MAKGDATRWFDNEFLKPLDPCKIHKISDKQYDTCLKFMEKKRIRLAYTKIYIDVYIRKANDTEYILIRYLKNDIVITEMYMEK